MFSPNHVNKSHFVCNDNGYLYDHLLNKYNLSRDTKLLKQYINSLNISADEKKTLINKLEYIDCAFKFVDKINTKLKPGTKIL
jgi:hypothetical protein